MPDRVPIPLLPRWLRWTAVLAVAGFIFYASIVSIPETLIDETHPWFIPLSYWRHLLAYAALAYTLAYATDHWSPARTRLALLVIVTATGYGALLEVGQLLTPHRTFDFLDIVVNAVGASLVLPWYAARPYLTVTPLPDLLDRGKG